MGSLYECLREARLDKFYRTLCSNGFTDCKSLLSMTSRDCTNIGIIGMTERQRLFDLIHIIRSVHESDMLDSDNSECEYQPDIKRNRHVVTHTAQLNTNQSSNPSPSSSPRRYKPTVVAKTIYPPPAIKAFVEDQESNSTAESTSDDEPTAKHSNTSSIQVEYVQHMGGYNYGLPRKRVQTRMDSPKCGEMRIRVCVRKRPLVKREVKAGEADIVTTVTGNTIHVKEPKVAVDLTPYTLKHEFVFDEVFGELVTNDVMYEKTAKPLVEKIFHGGKATCFAFGQTGAGKTYTMLGDKTTPGLYLLAATDIFERIRSSIQFCSVRVWVSFFEIYCGQLFDLLNKRNRLHAREDGSQRVCISGLTETNVTDVNSIMKVLDYGNTVRRKGSTGVNTDSSRSHAILQLELRNDKDIKFGRMSFIDLAGSERASDTLTDTDRQTRMEGAEINQSLLALKECIRAIDQDTKHTPFRQSKLTHILKESFVGNSMTCMIANVSPVQSACDNTLNTLRYAHRVKEMKRDIQTNESPSRSSSTIPSRPSSARTPAPTTSSMFQPSHLHSSTPMRPQSAIHHFRSDSHMTETPIRGFIPKTGSRSKRKTPVRHTPCISSDTKLQMAVGSSPSSSDKSDSCNLNVLSEPKVKVFSATGGREVAGGGEISVGNSDDTELDAGENIDLNDLNTSPGKGQNTIVENDVVITDVNDREFGDHVVDNENVPTEKVDFVNNSLNKAKLLVEGLDMEMVGDAVGPVGAVGADIHQQQPPCSLTNIDSDLMFGSAMLPTNVVAKGTVPTDLSRSTSIQSDSPIRKEIVDVENDPYIMNYHSRQLSRRSFLNSSNANQMNQSQTTDNTTTKPDLKTQSADGQQNLILPTGPESLDSNLESDLIQYCYEQRTNYDGGKNNAKTTTQKHNTDNHTLQHSSIQTSHDARDKSIVDMLLKSSDRILTRNSQTSPITTEKLSTTFEFTPQFSPFSTSISTNNWRSPVIDKDIMTHPTNSHGQSSQSFPISNPHLTSEIYTTRLPVNNLKTQPDNSTPDTDQPDTHSTLLSQPTNSLTTSYTASSIVSTSESCAMSRDYRRALTSPLPRERDAARLHVVTAHEEQLAKTTSLCKQEMKLLLGIKADADYTTFDTYLSRVDSALSLKLQQVQLMKDLIATYRETNRSAWSHST